MRKVYLLVALLSLGLIGYTNAMAQPDELGLEIGLGAGPALGLNESEDNEIKPYGRAVIGTTWYGAFQTELGFGYGQNGDLEWSVDLIPVDVRLRISPFGSESFKPYLFGGFGALYYEVGDEPENMPPNRDLHGWTGVIPFGVGFQYYFTEKLALDIYGGDNYTFSDELNPLNGDEDDSYLAAVVGLRTVVSQANPDKDGDGLLNKDEKRLGTDPNNPDTDGDGLNDGAEVNTYLTDPLKADTDGDGLNDGEEVNTYLTDPLKADTDGDGLNDFQEVKTYLTNALNPDTDGDGLSDYDEVMIHKTDPKKMDTDGDGLADGVEVNQYKSNPLLVDSDGGGIDDFEESKRGTNLLDPSDDIKAEEMIEVKEGIVLEGVTFETGKADLKPESEMILKKALNTMRAYPAMTVRIEGHTDNTGGMEMNMKLSKARAESVMNWLVGHGVDASRITAEGFGPNRPIADNKTTEGKAKNRRIEFVRTDTP